MTLPLALTTASLLAALAALHVYWAAGGQTGLGAALPEVRGQPAFRPGPGLTLLVAAGLTAAALVTAGLGLGLAPGFTRWAVLVLAGVFALRGVGDFRVMGLFKRVRGTRFAALDDRCYTPLCLLLATSLLWLALAGEG